jgi:nucleoside-diphosphate-sugar epimerase
VTPVVILGCGYVGTRVALAALAEGRAVRACARKTARLADLGARGAEIKYVEAGTPKLFTPAIAGAAGGLVLYSIPPVIGLPTGQSVRAALQASYAAGVGCFIYLSSSGLYGPQPDDDVWIDEDSDVVHDDAPMKGVLSDEHELEISSHPSPRVVTLRLAPVYGPGRGVRGKLRAGSYKILDDGSHATSRIHIDDAVRVIFAAERAAPHRARYLVADDEPTTQAEYARWLSDRLGVPMPESRAMFEPGAPKVAHRNRRIRNTRMKRELDLVLRYPSFRDGELAIEAEESAAPPPDA